MEIKTSELIGYALDLAVAICQNVELDEQGLPIWFDDDGPEAPRVRYSPSTNRKHAASIINLKRIAAVAAEGGGWVGGCTKLVAVMRGYVNEQIGPVFTVPAVAQARLERFNAIWGAMPDDYRGIAGPRWGEYEGQRTIVFGDKGQTVLMLLEDLAEEQIEYLTPKQQQPS